jgi:hypothetical protein
LLATKLIWSEIGSRALRESFIFLPLWLTLIRTVTLSEAEEFAQTVGAKHFQTSAKQSIGVDEVFFDLSKRILLCGDFNSFFRLILSI